ncbi:UNVERIFIED_CONTAM: hypothetical protein FKN15_007920 [Acipenser sinensis]
MARQYSVKGRSHRCPVAVFYDILNLAAINAYVLYKECTGENCNRRDFIWQLAMELGQTHMDQKRAETDAPSGSAGATAPTLKRKQCQVAKCNDNKTVDVCAGCGRAVCGKCSGKVEKRVLCVDCCPCQEGQTPPPETAGSPPAQAQGSAPFPARYLADL